MNKFHFVPECWAETMMVRNIFLDGGHHKGDDFYNHADGISSVAVVLKKQDISGFVNIGFVDDDKRIPPYLNEFRLMDSGMAVDFKQHPLSRDYLMVIKPAMEKFLLAQLREMGKSPSDYQLPDDFEQFKKVLKKVSVEHHPGYKQLLTDLNTHNTSGIAFIKEKVASLR